MHSLYIFVYTKETKDPEHDNVLVVLYSDAWCALQRLE
jgi:hypothetical protein